MRLGTSSIALCGPLWILLALVISGVFGSNVETTQLAKSPARPDLSSISTCGKSCLVQSITAGGCAVENKTCSCAVPNIGQRVASCIIANCTLQDALDVSKLQAQDCNLPHESQTNMLLAVLVAIYLLTIAIIGLRLVSKSYTKTWNIDDVLVVSAISIATFAFAFVVLMCIRGFGTHLYDLDQGGVLDILSLLYASEIVYILVILFAKLSLVTFYLRIFPVPKFRIAAHILIGFLVASQVVIGGFTLFSCHQADKFWNEKIKTDSCLDVNEIAYANSVLAIVQDFFILVLPLSMLPGLKMNWSKKISVAFMFLLGSVGIVSTVLRLRVLAVFGNSFDPTWDYVPVVVWTIIELGVVIICACLPMIRNLFEKAFPGFTLFKSTPPKRPPKNNTKKPFKIGRYRKSGRSQSPPEFSDNYVRDYITSPESRADYLDVFAYRGKPKVFDRPAH